jgi:hypothetical protein
MTIRFGDPRRRPGGGADLSHHGQRAGNSKLQQNDSTPELPRPVEPAAKNEMTYSGSPAF